LKGTPNAGSKAAVWPAGCDVIVGNECELTVTSAHNGVTVRFDKQQLLLKVAKGGSGSGTVTSSPAGINCGPTCEANFEYGTLVKLTGTPAADSEAVVWSGCDTVNGSNQCEVTMSAAKNVTATFDPQPRLEVFSIGKGSGTIVSDPPYCAGPCEEGK